MVVKWRRSAPILLTRNGQQRWHNHFRNFESSSPRKYSNIAVCLPESSSNLVLYISLEVSLHGFALQHWLDSTRECLRYPDLRYRMARCRIIDMKTVYQHGMFSRFDSEKISGREFIVSAACNHTIHTSRHEEVHLAALRLVEGKPLPFAHNHSEPQSH